MADPTPADPPSTNGEGTHENGAEHTETNTETGKTEGENTTHTNAENTPSTTTTTTSSSSTENTTETTTDDTTTAEAPMPSDDQLTEAIREIIKTHDPSEITLRKLKQLLEEQFGRDLTEKRGFIKDTIPVVLAENAKQEENGEENGEKEDGSEDAKEEEETKEESGEKEKESEDAGLNMSKADLEVQRLLMENIKYGGGRVTRGRASGKTAKPLKPSKKRKSTDGEKEDGEEEDEKPKKKKKGTSRANRPKDLSPALAEFLGESKMTRPEVVKRLHEYFKEHNLQNPKNKRQILFDEKLQQVFKKKTTDYFQLNTLLTKHLTDPGELV